MSGEQEELEGALQEMEGHVLRVEALGLNVHDEDLAERVGEMVQRLQKLQIHLIPKEVSKTPPAEPKPEPEPIRPPPRPPTRASGVNVGPLRQAFEKLFKTLSPLSLDPTDEGALRRWKEYFDKEPDPKSDALIALLALIDNLSWEYGFYTVSETHLVCDTLAAQAAALLRHLGGEAFPPPGFTGPILSHAGSKGYQIQKLIAPSSVGAGEVAHVIRRGTRTPKGDSNSLVVAVSSGTWNDALDAVEYACQALMKVNGLAVKDLRKILWKLADTDRDREASFLRMAINRIWDFEESEVKEPRKRLVDALDTRGVKLMWVPTGSKLDGTFPTSSFQSTAIASSEPKDTIVRVIRPGFLGPGGMPLQKALLGISTGQPD